MLKSKYFHDDAWKWQEEKRVRAPFSCFKRRSIRTGLVLQLWYFWICDFEEEHFLKGQRGESSIYGKDGGTGRVYSFIRVAR